MKVKLLTKYSREVKQTVFWVQYVFELVGLIALFVVVIFDFILGVI